MLNILFYGGCHALVLRDLFRSLFTPGTIETELVVNFDLIASGKPFPERLLEWSDVLVLSPIENKDSYNTDRLKERCRATKTKTVCFPWLEWHGYCPGAEKGSFKGRFQWFYPGLLEIAERFDRFDSFVEHVISNFPTDELIDRTFAHTTQIVTSAERRHDMEVKTADFIEGNYRSSRLFLISDHPSLALYKHVIEQIADVIGLRLSENAWASIPSREPQWRWRTPIFPRVADRLGLDFSDTDWIDDELVPHRTWPLETYLSLYFHKDSVILGPTDANGILLPARGGVGETRVDLGTRIFANPLPNDESDDFESYAYIETLAGQTIVLDALAPFKIDSKRWRSTWHF